MRAEAAWLFLEEVTNSMPGENASTTSEKIFEFAPSRTLENALLASRENIKFVSIL